MSVERVTNNTGLRIPYYDQPQWHVHVNDNWDIIDTLFSTLTRISGLTGAWQNATAYAQGQRAIDTTTNTLYEVLVSHTSASTGTFTADRTANPTYWGEVINLYSINGRAIQEVETVTDAAAEFVPGGTFELDGSNPRHYYVKVGDTSNPLTANMVVDLNPASSDWSTGGKVTIIKGDLSEFHVTVSGFDVDGLGTYALKRYRDGIECSYQTTDNNSGPGASGQKFERGVQSATYESNAFRAIGVNKYFGTDSDGNIVGYDIDPILLPNTVDSDGSGVWSPNYDTEIDGYGVVTFARASGDVTEGPLELIWPTMPVGKTHNIRFEEASTITAAARVFTLNVNWSDGAGVGILEIDEGSKTWNDFAPAIGDTFSGGPFDSPTTIVAIISSTIIHTADLPGETGSGDISLTAPADSIQGVRTIATPAMDDSGVIMVLTRRTASTATSRGEIDTGERISDFQDDIDALQAQIDELDGLSSISAQILAPSSTSNEYTLLDGDQVLALDSGDLQFNVGVIAENTDNPATALTQYLPTDATNGASFNIIREKGQTGEVTLRGADYALVLAPTADSTDTLTGLTEAETAPIAEGDAITGALIPGGTTILSKTTTTLTMSASATGTGATSVTVTVREAVFGLDPADAARDLVLPTPGPNSEAIITSVLCRRATTTGPFVPACWYTTERELVVAGAPHTPLINTNASGTITVDVSLYTYVELTATGNVTLAFSNATSGKAYPVTLKFTQDGSGGHTLTLPGSTKAAGGGTFPTTSTGAGDVDILTFLIDSGGTPHVGTFGLDWST